MATPSSPGCVAWRGRRSIRPTTRSHIVNPSDSSTEHRTKAGSSVSRTLIKLRGDTSAGGSVIGGGVLAAGGYGLATAGASVAALIAASNAAALAAYTAATGSAATSASLLGLAGMAADAVASSPADSAPGCSWTNHASLVSRRIHRLLRVPPTGSTPFGYAVSNRHGSQGMSHENRHPRGSGGHG